MKTFQNWILKHQRKTEYVGFRGVLKNKSRQLYQGLRVDVD